MTERRRWIERAAGWLGLGQPSLPSEILAAVFSAALDAGLTLDEAFGVMREIAAGIDADLAQEVAHARLRLAGSVDRARTYAALSASASSEFLVLLLRQLAAAEQSGEDLVARAQQIFETLSVEREAKVARRAETYPLVMIVFMVLFFLPALIVMLVGPLFVQLLQILNAI